MTTELLQTSIDSRPLRPRGALLLGGLAALLHCGCGGDEPPEDTPPAADSEGDTEADADTDVDTDTDTDSDSDTDTDSDSDADTDVEPGMEEGLLLVEGAAEVVERWEGSESIVLRREAGMGQIDCQITYGVSSLEAVKDCGYCALAWEVQLGAPTVEVGERCEDIGYGADAVAALEGERRRYGVALNYAGHANVLMQEIDGVWEVAAYVNWSEAQGTVRYEIDRGYYIY